MAEDNEALLGAIRRAAKSALLELRAAEGSNVGSRQLALTRLHRAAAAEGFFEAIGIDGAKVLVRAVVDDATARCDKRLVMAAARVSRRGRRVAVAPFTSFRFGALVYCTPAP